jgi:hypothetical protein
MEKGAFVISFQNLIILINNDDLGDYMYIPLLTLGRFFNQSFASCFLVQKLGKS